jgi:hypothetical protein
LEIGSDRRVATLELSDDTHDLGGVAHERLASLAKERLPIRESGSQARQLAAGGAFELLEGRAQVGSHVGEKRFGFGSRGTGRTRET